MTIYSSHEEALAQLVHELQHDEGTTRHSITAPNMMDQFLAAQAEIVQSHNFDKGINVTVEMMARCALAIADHPACKHLNAIPAQPAYARLASGRVVCKACLDANMAPLPDQRRADRCDWCGDSDVNEVWPLAIGLISCCYEGNACYWCCTGLGIQPVDLPPIE